MDDTLLTPKRTPNQEQEQQPLTPQVSSGKRRLTYTSSPLGLQSPAGDTPAGKKVPLIGFILQLGSILKGRRGRSYYCFQVQINESDVEVVTGFDVTQYKTLEHFYSNCAPVCVEAKVSIKDKSLVFDEYCFLRESEVSFELNEALKQKLIEQATSTVIDLKTLMKVDPFNSRTTRYTVTGLITFGLEELQEMPINQGATTAKVKKDILIEDGTRHMFLRLFEGQLSKVTTGKCHQLTHLVLKQYQGQPYVHTSRDSLMTEIEDLSIESSANQYLTGARVITIKEFTGVKDIAIFDVCPAKKNRLKVVRQTTAAVWCECGAMVKKARLGEKSYSVFVEFEDEGKFVWLQVLSDELKKIFPNPTPNATDIQDFLCEVENLSCLVNEDKIVKFL